MTFSKTRFLLSTLLVFAAAVVVSAQFFSKIDENLLIESKWKYTYTMHLETNTIVHQAEDYYQHFLYFRYDSTFEQYLNGQLSDGRWSLVGNVLNYPFRHIKKFAVTNLTELAMDIEFNPPNGKGTMVYHFIKVESRDAPFLRRENELPEIVIESKSAARSNELTLVRAEKVKKKRKKGRDSEPYISVELVGGGFYGGIDPVLRDYIVIKNDGRLVKEFKSLNSDLQVVRKDIPREELEMFAEWVTSQKFFDMSRQYDCLSAVCEKRKFVTPRPVPLRISVTYGSVRKMVTVSIWGKDKNGETYIEYPPNLDLIVDAIQRLANRV